MLLIGEKWNSNKRYGEVNAFYQTMQSAVSDKQATFRVIYEKEIGMSTLRDSKVISTDVGPCLSCSSDCAMLTQNASLWKPFADQEIFWYVRK